MDVRAYSDSTRAPLVGTFRTHLVGMCGGDRLLEQKVLTLIAQELRAKGLTEADEADAVFVVGCEMTQGTVYEQGDTYSYPVKNLWTGETIGTYSTTVGGGDRTVYQRDFTLQAYASEDIASYVDGAEEPVPIWSGTASSVGSTADLLTVAPYIILELLDEFPVSSGKPSQRTVPFTP